LSSISAEGRKDMFRTLVLPLFNATYMLLTQEPSKTHRETLERTKKIIFKQFMGLSKSTNSILVEDMLRTNIEEKANLEYERSLAKWEARKIREPFEDLKEKEKKINPLKGVPSTWIELVNTQCKKCPKCKDKLTNRFHLLYKHGFRLKHISRIWREEILPVTEDTERKRKEIDGMTIREFNKIQLTNIIDKHLKDYYTTMSIISRPNGLKPRIRPFYI
jgi:hypothetical protein